MEELGSNLGNQPMLRRQAQTEPRYPGLSILAKSILASLMLVGALGLAQFLWSGKTAWPLHGSGDAVGAAEVNARVAAFAALQPIKLALISREDAPAAIEAMGLTPAAKAALTAYLQDSELPAASPNSATDAPAVKSDSAQPARHPRLAWISLWDTDAEDGDAVRIESQGYSRTVTLSKQPVTFAVPVPLDGVLKVTGVVDGEGGGITVGFASGASRAAFPIMSVGQVLGLKVRLD